jgi:ketosteroid isomerase-like protein
MNPIRTLAAALVTAILVTFSTTPGLSAAPAPAPEFVTLPASYVTLYEQIFAHEALAKRMTAKESAALGHVALRLWRRTGDAAYREKARELFAMAVSDPQFSLKDFHLLHHFGELAWAMKQENLLSAEQEASLAALAIKELHAFCDSKDDADNKAMVGLYYFDGWSNEQHLTKLLTTEFADRKPVWGWKDDTVEIMQKQIDYCADHDIAFWAFDGYYPEARAMETVGTDAAACHDGAAPRGSVVFLPAAAGELRTVQSSEEQDPL